VERLLEGVAFLTGLLREKLDDEFPEVIHGLMQLIFPHYLRPLPSTAILTFTPKKNLKQTVAVPSGVHIESIPVEGTSCTFRTCYDVEVHPLSIAETSLQETPGHPPALRLLFRLNGLSLSDWQPKRLRLFIGGEYPIAADIYYLLRCLLKRIIIRPLEGGSPAVLPADALKPAGFSDESALIPYPAQSFPGYRVLQEYFLLPEKFLFLDLEGFDRWKNRGDGTQFEVLFELARLPLPPPPIKEESFVLFATPAINLFHHEAKPIRLGHGQPEYRVLPEGMNREHYQVYSIENIVGFQHGTGKRREYVPFGLSHPESPDRPVYHASMKPSPTGRTLDVSISVAYHPRGGPPVPETLSIYLTCTNGILPEDLQVGDISQPTSTSPGRMIFRNITAPTAVATPPLGKTLLWRFISHLSMNYLCLADTENIKTLLNLYIFQECRDRAKVYANRKRVDGIRGLEVEHENRLVHGVLMQGQRIRLKLLQDSFASEGDLYLFGSVMDHFLASYAGINSFTHLSVEDVLKGEAYHWPARIGNRPLL
jgi:type VI secretion system protein ImpG